VISLDDVRAARERIAGMVVRTPLVELKYAGRPKLYVKCENLQKTGAFKLRGATNKIARLPAGCPGVVAYSSGNHAQATACAAQARGIKACIVMLDQSVAVKVEGTRAFGAEVVFGGKISSALKDRAEAIAAERGWALVPPFDDPDIIAGQGTAGLEIVEDLPDVAAVLVPVGGGGLISGVATAVKGLRPATTVFGVEPAGAPKMSESLRKGELVTLASVDTVADGLKPVRASERTFEHVKARVDAVVTVTDEAILEAARHLIQREKLVVEPSGAATLAAVRSGRVSLPEGPVVCLISGGNADLKAVLGL
jgi:threonine dehydratase